MIATLLGALAVATAVAGAGARPMRRPAPRSTGAAVHRWPFVVRAGRRAGPPGVLEVATWCDDVARRVRGGASLVRALPDSGAPPCASGLELAIARGAPLAEACRGELARCGAGRPWSAWRLAVGVVMAIATVGAPAGDALERTARVLRARHADDDERRVHAAQARASAAVLTALPVAGLGAMAAASTGVRDAIAGPGGAAAIVAGLLLNVAGWGWARSIVARGST